MEVDEEVEADLLRQFNCLNTSDKDVLIKELQGLLGRGSDISEQSARFYLDMADWNLQAAICAYFDLQSSTRLPQMTFLQDVTIGEGESVPPNTSFVKTWRVENTGNDAWPEGCRLLHTGGDRLGAEATSAPLLCLAPRTRLDVSVQMVAPGQQGLYSSKWRMTTPQGHFFGDTIWVIIQVDDGGTLALMQQMMNFKELGSSPPQAPPPSPAHGSTIPHHPPHAPNPFSPHKDTAIEHSSHASVNTIFGGGGVGTGPSSSSRLQDNTTILTTSTITTSLCSINSQRSYFSSTSPTNTITSCTGSFPSPSYCCPSSPLPASSHLPDEASSQYVTLPTISSFLPISSPCVFHSNPVASSIDQSTHSSVLSIPNNNNVVPSISSADSDHDVTMS